MKDFMWTASKKSRVRTCLACQGLRRKQRRQQNPEQYRQADLVRRLRVQYGLTIKDYESLLAAQDHKCSICRRGLDAFEPHVDHSHATGQVRGLLCFNCNTGLGHFRDDITVLKAAIEYLDRPAPQIAGRSRTLHPGELSAIRSTAAKRQHGSVDGRAALADRAKGAQVLGSKLDDAAVGDIRERYARGGVSQAALAVEFGVTQGNISQIVRRLSWTHLP